MGESIVTLAAALLFAPFVGGRWNVPVAAWLLPALVLIAGQELSSGMAYLAAVGVLVVGGLISLAGQVPLPPPAYVAMVVVTEGILALPYLASRLAAPTFEALVDAFVDLPFALPTIVAGLTLLALYGPKSPFGFSVAYTQVGLVMALLFVTLPFVVRAVQPVLIELDQDMEEAAASLALAALR